MLWGAPALAQECDGEEESLLDAQIIVSSDIPNNPEAYCIPFSFDASVTGWPIGITMDLWHEYEGDLSISVAACGQVLNVLQRPGLLTGNCDTPLCNDGLGNCGSNAQIGTQDDPVAISFLDNGPEPDNGISAGGTFGLTQDDACGVSTLPTNSFVELWDNCANTDIDAEICFADHAFRHLGYVSNLNFIFPNPVICGCRDENALNYNPEAGLNDGSCLYECPELDLRVNQLEWTICTGTPDTLSLLATADSTYNPFFEWFLAGAPSSWLSSTTGGAVNLHIPADFVGVIVATVLVENDIPTCTETTQITINVVPNPSANLVAVDALCPGDSTWLSGTDTPPNATFQWHTGATTDSTFTSIGPYALTVTSAATGCTSTRSGEILALTAPQPSILGTDTICAGTQTPLAVVDTFATSLWSTGANGATILADSAGGYQLTVTNAEGCSGTTAFQLYHFPAPSLALTGDTLVCWGDSTQWLAPDGFTEYLWSNGDTTASTWVTDTLPLTLTVRDSNTCIQQITQQLNWSPLPNPALLGDTLFCLGDTVTWGTTAAFAQYAWSTGDTTSTIAITEPGRYGLTVTDTLACTNTISADANQTQAPPVAIVGPDRFCPGTSLALSASPGFTAYEWSTGDSSPSTSVTTATTVYLTATDANGCTAQDSLVVGNFPAPDLSINGAALICAGDTTTLAAAPNFSGFQWSTGETTANIQVHLPGDYTLIAQDENACVDTAFFTLMTQNLPDVSVAGQQYLCANDTTELVASAGFEHYLWSTGVETDQLRVHTPGTYQVSVTDTLGCVGNASVTLVDAAPSLALSDNANLCTGDTLQLMAADTFATYQWSTGSTSAQTFVTESGEVSLTVTNDSSCVASTSITISSFPLPEPQILGDSIFCPATSTTLNVAPIFTTYAWNTPTNTGPTITPAVAGMYSVTVTDDNGCSGTDSLNVLTFSVEPLHISGPTSFCADASTTLLASPGFTTYSWDNGAEGTSAIYTQGGTATLTATDENNCVATADTLLTAWPLPQPTIQGDSLVCTGEAATLSVADDFINYQWSTGATVTSITTDQTGPISLTVEDGNGCVGTTNTTLANHPEPQLSIDAPAGVCSGSTVSLNAPATFATYQWSTTANTAAISTSTAGVYQLTITDENGCAAADTVTLASFALPTFTLVGDPAFCAGNSTIFSIENPNDWQLNWSNGSTADSTLVDAPGLLGLLVTDENGCSDTTSINVAELPLPSPTIDGELLFCPEGSTTLSVVESYPSYQWPGGVTTASLAVAQTGDYTVTVTDAQGCNGTATASVANHPPPTFQLVAPEGICAESSYLVQGPTGFDAYQWSDGSTNTTYSLPAGESVALTITDANTCSAADTVSLLSYALPMPSLTGNLSFCTDNTTTLGVETLEEVTYEWSTGATTDTLLISQAGDYAVTVTDNNGCTGVAAAGVTEVANLSPSIQGQTPFCPGTSTTLSSTAAYATYLWSNNGETASIEISEPGLYTLSVTDEQGCTGDTTINVTLHNLPPVAIQGDSAVCAGNSAIWQVIGDVDTYQWSNASATVTTLVETANTYTVTVTDANDCPQVLSADFDVWELPTPSIDGNTSFCVDETTELSVTTSYPSYQWSTGGEDQQVTVIAEGLVSVTVTDGQGCQGSNSTMVTVLPLPVADAGADAALDCGHPITTLGADNNPTGDDYDYSWTGPGIDNTNAFAPSPSVGEAGEYTLQIMNTSTGCASMTATVMVTDDRYEPEVIISVPDSLDCTTETVTLDGSSSQTSPSLLYQWLDQNNEPIAGANGPFYQATDAQLYTLLLVDTLTSCEGSSTVSVSNNTSFPAVNAGPDQDLNCATPTATVLGTVSPNSAAIVTQWLNEDGAALVAQNELSWQANTLGLYQLLATDTTNGCSTLDTMFVTEDFVAPVAVVSDDLLLPCDEASVTISGQGSTTAPGLSYQWYYEEAPIAGANQVQWEATLPGIYELLVLNANNGCADTA
ncbi:MAG: hypothetical protein AAGJ82_05695, partial [Bacteroidota bacterium]